MANNPVQVDPAGIPRPPEFVFKYRGNRTAPSETVLEQEATMFVLTGMKYPPNDPEATEAEKRMGGQLAYFDGVPYPSKGFPFPEALYAVNAVKRLTMDLGRMLAGKDMAFTLLGFAITPRKWKVAAITRACDLYRETAMMFLGPYILKTEYQAGFTRELRKLVTTFLTSLGVPFESADGAAEVFTTLIEYDNAYRLRIEDLLSETTKEALLKNPARGIKRLMAIYCEREPDARTDFNNQTKFAIFGDGLRFALWVPSIRRAFNAAMGSIDFSMLQLDEADRYNILLWRDYNFLGKTIEERWQIFSEIHKGQLPPRLVYRKAA